MMNLFQKFGMALVLIASVNACGRAAVNGNTASTLPQPSENQETLKAAAAAKCVNPSPLDVAPESWVEIKPEAIQGDESFTYQLALMQINGVMVFPDGHMASGTTLTEIGMDDVNGVTVKQEVICKDLREGEKLTMDGQPVLSFSALTGEFAQRLAVKYLLLAGSDEQTAKPYDVAKNNKNFFSSFTEFPEQKRKMQEKGDDLLLKVYQSPAGDFEMRATAISAMQTNKSRLILNAAVRYLARKAELK